MTSELTTLIDGQVQSQPQPLCVESSSVDDILERVPGVGAVLIGASDLGLKLGHPHQYDLKPHFLAPPGYSGFTAPRPRPGVASNSKSVTAD
jgi:hypothetical protein